MLARRGFLSGLARAAAGAARGLSDEPLTNFVPRPTARSPRRVIIDSDPGVDDSFAIALALRSPELAVHGITIVAGNSVHVEQMGRNAVYIASLCDRSDVPVFLGARGPLEREFRGQIGEFCHGANGLGNVAIPAELDLEPLRRESDVSGQDFLAKTVSRLPGEVSVVALGPLTNVAQACALTRTFSDALEFLAVMGGAVHVGGNVTPTAEFNAYCDPEAFEAALYRVVSPIVVSALDVTTQVPLTPAFLAELRDASPLGATLARIAAHYTSSLESKGYSAFLHDAVSVMTLLRPDLFRCRRERIEVVVGADEHAGQTRPAASANGVEIVLVTSVDEAALKADFIARIASVPARRPS